MHNQYKISVVIPIYNAEAVLQNCLDSIYEQADLSQSQIEILLINNDSPDSCLEICEAAVASHKNVRLINIKKSELPSVRNKGIEMASGKYIAFINAYDTISQNTLSRLVQFFDDNYDIVDLVAYPMYSANTGSINPNYKKQIYSKETGIYDVDTFWMLDQSTSNIVIKNEHENNQLFDPELKMSHVSYFNDTLIMKKRCFGYVANASYIVGDTIDMPRAYNYGMPYYGFDKIMDYSNRLMDIYMTDEQVPFYIQHQILLMLLWRTKSDLLLPYHLEGEEFKAAQKRVFMLLDRIDERVIIDSPLVNKFFKVYFLKEKQQSLSYEIRNKTIIIRTNENQEVCSIKRIHFYIHRMNCRNGRISLSLFTTSPLSTLCPIDAVVIRETGKGGKITKTQLVLKESEIPFRAAKMPVAKQYLGRYEFELKSTKSLKFTVLINNVEFPVDIRCHKFSGFDAFNNNQRRVDEFCLKLNKRGIDIRPYSIKIELQQLNRIRKAGGDCLSAARIRRSAYGKKRVWLYVDAPKILDNGFIQFKHDIQKKDGINRYYVVHPNSEAIFKQLSKECKDNIVIFGSPEHKKLFVQAEIVFVAYDTYSCYCPFTSDVEQYKDLFHYELIYLQHGILHAHLPYMYGRAFTDFSKIIISSEFEKKNLVEHYGYLEEDLIYSGMPRYEGAAVPGKPKNAILFAPSWRQYLIGNIENGTRQLKENQFLGSELYKQTNKFLHSSELGELLESNDIYLDFKLHPIFKPYEKLFDLSSLPRIRTNNDTIMDDYKMLITDFSSFQFDFVRLVRPVAYFVPDMAQFKGGLHTYRELDLKHEDAFGPICLDASSLIDEMKHVISKNFRADELYYNRMDSFLSLPEHPCETIYQTLLGKELN